MTVNPSQFRLSGETKFPFQLSMFEQARTLMNAPQIDTLLTGRSPAEVNKEKLAESSSPEYADHIRETEARMADPDDYMVKAWGHKPQPPVMDDSPTLTDSIRAHGIKRPVIMDIHQEDPADPVLTAVGDGQHRVAVQNAINPMAEVRVDWRDWREEAQH